MMKFLIPALLLLVAGPAMADARCDEADFRKIRKAVHHELRCEERVIRGRHRSCTGEMPPCGQALADDLLEVLAGEASPGAARHARRAEARCQIGALRAGTTYVHHRMRDRVRGRRRAAYASPFVERVANACEGVVVGKELPSFGGACAELLAPGEPLPATLLAHCLRASLERIIDDAAPEPLRPNVVLVLTDDQRPETLEFLPEIDRLADQGVLFTNAFATTSICTPSRASIYSGQYAHNHGSRTNNRVFDDSDTLAPWMSEAGYATGFFGKYRNDIVPGAHVPPGWDEWNAFSREEESQFTCGGPNSCFYDYPLNENGVLTMYGDAAEDYSTDVLADRLLDFVEEHGSLPFFAVYAPYAAHAPAKPAPRHEGSFADLPPWRPLSWNAGDLSLKPLWVAFARFLFGPAQAAATDQGRIDGIESLQSVDEAVGDLVGELERLGLRDNTIVIFTSDQGLHWGEHGWTSKLTAYEESIRIPFVVSYPLRSPLRDERTEMVLNIDIAPTIAEAADAVTGPVDGSSLLPLLEGPAPWRDDFLIENFVAFIAQPNLAIRTPRWKYILTDSPAGVVEELYDLDADPHELANLAFDPDHGSVLARLASRLAELRGR